MGTNNEFILSLIKKTEREKGVQINNDAALHLITLASEECYKIVHDYIWQTKSMEARGCLASVSYDIKNRFSI